MVFLFIKAFTTTSNRQYLNDGRKLNDVSEKSGTVAAFWQQRSAAVQGKRICKMGSELGLGSTFQGKVLHFIPSPVTHCATLNQFPRNTKLHKIMIIT